MNKTVTMLSLVSLAPLSLLGMQPSFSKFSGLPVEVRQLIITHVIAHALDKNSIAQSLRNLRLVNKEFNNFLTFDNLTCQNIIKVLAQNIDVSPRVIALNIIKAFNLKPNDPITQRLLKDNPVNKALNGPLLRATDDGDIAQIQNLFRQGADANAQDSNGNTALMLAIAKNYQAIAELLLNHDADATVRSSDGYTALDIARRQGNQKIQDMLRKVLREQYKQQVFDAVMQGDLETLVALSKQVPMNMRDDNGNTPLHIAIVYDKPDIISFILNINPTLVYVKNNEGKAPVDLAVKNPCVLRQLIRLGH